MKVLLFYHPPDRDTCIERIFRSKGVLADINVNGDVVGAEQFPGVLHNLVLTLCGVCVWQPVVFVVGTTQRWKSPDRMLSV